jgi:hypothetical protein
MYMKRGIIMSRMGLASFVASAATKMLSGRRMQIASAADRIILVALKDWRCIRMVAFSPFGDISTIFLIKDVGKCSMLLVE